MTVLLTGLRDSLARRLGANNSIQVKGPYRKWHHFHKFESLGKGTLIYDRVAFKLPLGLFGDTFIGRKVARDVNEIFKFRREKILEIFK